MKKRLLILATIVVGLGLTACSVDTTGLEDTAKGLEEQLDQESNQMDESTNSDSQVVVPGATYQCPDDCENGPSYDEPGPCVKCGNEMEIL